MKSITSVNYLQVWIVKNVALFNPEEINWRMKPVIVKKADTKHRMNDFVRLTDMLYADSPYYVPDFMFQIWRWILEMLSIRQKIWDWSILSFNRL